MIVKNERHVIERCLASVKAIIGYWVIVDTGSTDGTQQVVRNYLGDIPGELIERPWVDFAHNRSEALAYARDQGDYLLIIDADEVLAFDANFAWPALTRDGYSIESSFGGLSYRRTQLVKNTGDWFYQGVVHEHITSWNRKTIGHLNGVVNLPHRDGARSADPHKFKRDALALEKALLEEPDNDRYVFYLANSYRDAGDYEAALKQYQRRVDMGGDPEHVWYALYQIALMRLLLDEPWEKVLHGLLEAYAYRPTRAEPLYRIIVYYRDSKAFPLAHLFVQQAITLPLPQDALFVEKAVYEYRIPFEYAICCYWAGQHAEAIRVNNRILAIPGVAPEIFDQAIKNRRFSLDVLYPAKASVRPGNNRFKVFVPFRDPGTFLDNCIASLLEQDHGAFEMVFFDNGSGDESHRYVPTDDSRVTLVRYERPIPLARIRHTFITRYCQPDDIVVYVDGADWLADGEVLPTLDRLYNAHDCGVLYGQYGEANGRYGQAQPYPDEAAFSRLDRDAFPHLIQTFRAGMYQAIQGLDPRYTCMKDAHGHWHDPAPHQDHLLMAPILRQAGFDKVRFQDQVLYILNTDRDGRH
jgi:glycosyltransferase involved in cell wall biosynthesis